MKKLKTLLLVWFFANILIGSSFLLTDYFWIFFPLSLGILILISAISLKGDLKVTYHTQDILYGGASGIGLFFIFLLSYLFIRNSSLPLLPFIQDLYSVVGPKLWWHHLLLILIVIPGEEIYWRRYLQPQLTKLYGSGKGVLLAASLYAFAHVWTGNPLLVMAAATAGICWGALYQWKKSLLLVIISHFIFDLLLLYLFPLNF